jgi:hypothetical protein
MATVIRLLLVSIVCTIGIPNRANAGASWIEVRNRNYSVFYQSGYEHDARYAQHWLRQSEC